MNKIKNKFRASFQTRMVIYFYVLTMIPVLIASVVLHGMALHSVTSMATAASRQIVDSVSNELDELMGNMSSLPVMLRSDISFQQMLRKEYQTEAARVTDAAKGTATLVSLNRFQPDIYGIYVLMDNGMAMKSRYFDLQREDFRASATYQYVHAAEGQVWLTPEQGSTVAETVGDPVIACGAPMRDVITGETKGIILVEAKKFLIQKKLSLDIGKGGELFLMDADRKPVALTRQSTRETYLLDLLQTQSPEQFIPTSDIITVKDGILVYHRLSANGWYVAGFIPQRSLRLEGRKITVVVVLIALSSWLAICIAATKISKYELQPIHRIVQTMRRIEQNDDLQARCEVVRPDEIGDMASSFNQMTEHVLRLNESIRAEQERLRQAEFRALQAQIKPHFLYNTLDSIAWLSRRQENGKVIEMVMALTDFFRVSLSGGADIISIAEELEHVISYLKIQKIRYESLFDYDIYAEESAREYLIPKLVLQPIVENALYHGIKPSGRRCMIHIHVLEQSEYLHIEVLDDGDGMTAETLQRLRDAIDHCEHAPGPRAGQGQIFGIRNVSDRLRSFSDGRYGLSISSAPGIGTMVSLQLAKKRPE